MKDLGIGFSGYGRALGFAFRNGLWWAFLVPALLWILFAAGLIWLSTAAVDFARDYAHRYLDIAVLTEDRGGWPGFWDDVKAFFDTARDIAVLVVVKLALWFLFGIIGKYVILIVLSPLLAYASERTEEILTGRRIPFRLGRFLRDVGRGILMAIRNASLELLINLCVWVVTLLIAPIAPLSAIFLWLVSCWFYGFSMFDYIFERQRLGIGASARAARGRRGLVLGNGILFNLLMKIPLLGVMFAPLLAAIGAVFAWHDRPAGTLAPDRT